MLDRLREEINEHSFSAFIEPLKLIAVEDDAVLLESPPDAVSWVKDHFKESIEVVYREVANRPITLEIK